MESQISDFYTDKSILVTGATGFIGKVLIEKLLYSCPRVDKIYLLIRGAKGKSAAERLEEMIGQKPFNMRLKKDFINKKLVAVESDLSEPELALSASNKSTLINNVSLVFHVAASVKFEAPLEVNIKHNVVATKALLDLACQFKVLKCFVHVSTAYSNCQLRQIDERIYSMDVPNDPTDLKVTKEMIDNRPNTYTYTKAVAENVAAKYADRMNVVIVRPSIVMSSMEEPAEGWVDTINGPVGLSVLGALGILQKIKVNSEVVFDLIPVDIVTNALISIAWAAVERKSSFLPGSSPIPVVNHQQRGTDGAINDEMISANGINNIDDGDSNSNLSKTVSASAIISAINNNNNNGKSLSRLPFFTSNKSNSNTENNNSIINSSSKSPLIGRKLQQQDESTSSSNKLDGTVRVFNLTTGSENPCSFYQYFSTGREEAYRKPSARALRPLLHIPKQKGMNPIQYWIHKIFSHLLFAYIVDSLLSLFGQKRMVVKAVNRMHHANEVFDYFCSNQWHFVTDNVKQLRDLQSPKDRSTFNCDVRAIDWSRYAQVGWLGCRRFILKEDDSSFDAAKQRYRVICFIYYLVKIFLLVAFGSLAKLMFSSSPIALWMFLMPVYGVIYLL